MTHDVRSLLATRFRDSLKGVASGQVQCSPLLAISILTCHYHNKSTHRED